MIQAKLVFYVSHVRYVHMARGLPSHLERMLWLVSFAEQHVVTFPYTPLSPRPITRHLDGPRPDPPGPLLGHHLTRRGAAPRLPRQPALGAVAAAARAPEAGQHLPLCRAAPPRLLPFLPPYLRRIPLCRATQPSADLRCPVRCPFDHGTYQ